MESGSFFGGLLKGFGGGLLQNQQRQQQQQSQGQQELLNFYLQGIEEERLNPDLAWPLVAGILADPLQGVIGGGKGRRGMANALAALADPDNLAQFLGGAHQGFAGRGGQAGRPLEGVGPAPMGRTNPPEMRPVDVTPEMEPQEVTPAPPAARGRPLAAVPPAPSPSATPSGLMVSGTFKGATPPPSTSIAVEGRHVLIPTVSPDGQALSEPDAVAQFRQTGQHLGVFDSPEHATAYAQQLGTPEAAPLAPLPTRQTMIAPPERRRSLFLPRGEREAQATQRKVAEQTATTAATYQGRIQVAEKLIRDETDTFRRTNHREPTPEDVEAIRTNAYGMVGMDATARRATPAAAEINARTLYETALKGFRKANGGRDPSPEQQGVMMRQALREEADAAGQASKPPMPAYQQKEVLLDGTPALVNYDAHTGKYSVGDQDVSARVQPMPATVDPTLQALRQMQLDTARRGAAGRAVTAADARRVGEFNSGRDDLAVLNDVIATTGATGTRAAIGAAVPNWVTNVTGWGTDAKQKQALIDRVKQVIGKTLEGGVLRKEDEIKYTRILPTIGDPNAVVLSKLQGLDAAIEQRRQDHLDALSDAGYDVSKFQARPTRPPLGSGGGGGGHQVGEIVTVNGRKVRITAVTPDGKFRGVPVD